MVTGKSNPLILKNLPNDDFLKFVQNWFQNAATRRKIRFWGKKKDEFFKIYSKLTSKRGGRKIKALNFFKIRLKTLSRKIESVNFKKFTKLRIFQNLLKMWFKIRLPVEKYGCGKSEKTNFSKFTQNWLQNAVAEKLKRWIFSKFVLKGRRGKIKALNFENFAKKKAIAAKSKLNFSKFTLNAFAENRIWEFSINKQKI